MCLDWIHMHGNRIMFFVQENKCFCSRYSDWSQHKWLMIAKKRKCARSHIFFRFHIQFLEVWYYIRSWICSCLVAIKLNPKNKIKLKVLYSSKIICYDNLLYSYDQSCIVWYHSIGCFKIHLMFKVYLITKDIFEDFIIH